jgi:hypothetical protein
VRTTITIEILAAVDISSTPTIRKPGIFPPYINPSQTNSHRKKTRLCQFARVYQYG